MAKFKGDNTMMFVFDALIDSKFNKNLDTVFDSHSIHLDQDAV